MALYETVFIARPDISSKDVDDLVAQFSGILKDKGGNVVKTEYWGLRNLAYRVNKNRRGHYALLGVDAPADALKEMERNIRLSPDVLRYMSVKVDEISKEESPIMKEKDEQ